MESSIKRAFTSSLVYLSLFSASAYAADILTQEQQRLKHQQILRETKRAFEKAEEFLSEEKPDRPKDKALDDDNANVKKRISLITIDQAGKSTNLNFTSVIQQYQNKPLTTNQVLNLVKDLTDVLYQAGYVTSAIGLKEKVTDKNELHFIIHWGYVSNYLVNGEQPKQFRDKAMVAVLPDIRNAILSVHDIDQFIEILNTTNKSAEIKVLAAEKTGESNLNIITQRTFFPQFTLGFNNSGADNNANGRNQLTANVSWSDLLGTNDRWYFSTGYRLYKGHKQNNQQNYSLSYSQPFGFYTLDLRLSQSDNEKELRGRNSYSSSGKIQTANIKLSNVLSRSKTSILSAYGELEFKKRKNYIGTRLVSLYHNNKLTIGLSYITNFLDGKLYNDISYSNGLNWFHADSLAYTREKSKTLKLISGSISWYKPFVINQRYVNYQFRIGLQYSPYALYSDNQFSIGDEYTVRGFKGGISSGESGYYFSQTLELPFYPEQAYLSQIKPFVGIDFGRTFRRIENRHESIAGFAIGARTQIKQLALSFTYAKPLKNISDNKTGNAGVYYMNGSVSF
ncbi:hemolysin activation/secretion protein [Cricetibacter osteomyelitidis]|uniref:Hemolysin activation/secretion protein n=1 Tax=Cricetibacter osteomyelitidis TaxID=1521931 RepID=A0A4R2SSL6_9PAST|nr:ShlB/FhaC/HecB family hemolysin secretion/activation protein [Cricetibacter osteomyelitidis]TCP91244.1 hemolysin activation/secretion protein [Cricetibacter osteomyelitidis]